MKAGIEVNGAQQLRRALKDAGDDDLKDELKSVHLLAAEEVLSAVRAPRRSGALSASVRASASVRGGRVSAGKKAVPYAGVIHFGWPARNITRDPFLYEALHRRVPAIVEEFEHGMQRIADEVSQKANSGG